MSGKSVVGDEFKLYGIVNLFESVGMLPIINLPDACYPLLVQEFYGNLFVDDDEDFISEVRGQRICLNSSVFNCMLKFKGLLNEDLLIPLTKKGVCSQYSEFPKEEQHRIIRGDLLCEDFTLPTTAMFTTMSNLLFKICVLISFLGKEIGL